MTNQAGERNRGRELLRRAVGADAADSRPDQWEAIDALVNHRRKLLIVERTGWGKSVIYFIASICRGYPAP